MTFFSPLQNVNANAAQYPTDSIIGNAEQLSAGSCSESWAIGSHAGAAALPLCSPSVCRNRSRKANSWAIQELPALLTFPQSWACPHLMGSDLSYHSNFCAFLIFHCHPDSRGSWLSCCVVAGQLQLFSQPHMNQQINQNIVPWVISNLLKAIGNPVVPAPFLWPLVCAGCCSEWVAGCTVTLPQHRQLQVAIGVFCQLLAISGVGVVALIDNTRRGDHCCIQDGICFTIYLKICKKAGIQEKAHLYFSKN